MEIDKLRLKFNKEKVVFNLYECTLYVVDMEKFYQMEEKGRKVDKKRKKDKLSGVRVSLVPDVP